MLLIATLHTRGTSAQAVEGAVRQPANSRIDFTVQGGVTNPAGTQALYYTTEPGGTQVSLSLSAFATRLLGLQVENVASEYGSDFCAGTVQAGPIVRLPIRSFIPFAHGLGGSSRITGPVGQPCSWGYGFTAGAGLDYVLPRLHDRLAVRLFQADYTYTHVTFAEPTATTVSGGLPRLSAGLALRLGTIAPPRAAQLACPVERANVIAGERVSLTAVSLDVAGRGRRTYTWSTSGGSITGSGETIAIDTTGLAPGDYVVTGKLLAAGHRTLARCSSGFRVQALAPLRLTDRDRSADAQVSLAVVEPTPATVATPPAPQTQAAPEPICLIAFAGSGLESARLDDDAKVCLDRLAARLQEEPSAHIVLLGRHAGDESARVAAQRTLSSADYLVHTRQVAPERIEMRTGGAPGQVAEGYVLAPGERPPQTNSAPLNPPEHDEEPRR